MNRATEVVLPPSMITNSDNQVSLVFLKGLGISAPSETSAMAGRTLLLNRAGWEEDVGELTHRQIPAPSVSFPRSPTYYVFLSHTGRDGVKEDIARPTHWFLQNVLNIDAFLDDEDAIWSDGKMRALIEHAYRCTHALVILSPSFRQQRYCIMELNTFMSRSDVHVMPALWGYQQP